MDLGIPIFLIFVRCVCGLEKLGLVDQNCLECDLCALLLKTIAVGRRQQSESIEVALLSIKSKEVKSTVLILAGAISC